MKEDTTPIVLPAVLRWYPTLAKEPRNGEAVTRVVVHRWGVRYTTENAEATSYYGVCNYFSNPANQASAHIVYPGSALPNRATQMVRWNDAAWAEAAYNRTSDDIESADAIWLGHDPRGMQILARIVAFRLHERNLPAVWSAEHGFCRHADLGEAGGGHLECPTTELSVWEIFVSMVKHELARGGFLPSWGR